MLDGLKHLLPFLEVFLVGLFFLFLIVYLALPGLIVDRSLSKQNESLSYKDRFELEQGLRKLYLQVFGGVLLVVGLVFTFYQVELQRESQVTKTYTESINNLAAEDEIIRAGSFYTLAQLITLPDKYQHEHLVHITESYFKHRYEYSPPRFWEEIKFKKGHPNGPEYPSCYRHNVFPRPEGFPPPGKVKGDVEAGLYFLGKLFDYPYHSVREKPIYKFDFENNTRIITRLFKIEEKNTVDLSNVKIKSAIIGNLRMESFKATNSDFSGTTLYDNVISSSSFENSNFQGSKFYNNIFEHANFYRANLRESEFRNTQFQLAILKDAKLEGSCFYGVSLTGAYLHNADFRFAQLYDVDFADANLKSVDLRGADLSGVKNLTSKQIENALIDEHTTLPKDLK